MTQPDTLRLEMKYALNGNDIDETTNPLEAGLGWVVKPAKGPFLGRDAIERVRAAGPSRAASVDQYIGIGYAPAALAAVGSAVEVRGRGQAARVVKTPFPSAARQALGEIHGDVSGRAALHARARVGEGRGEARPRGDHPLRPGPAR